MVKAIRKKCINSCLRNMAMEMVGHDFAQGQLQDGIDGVKLNQGSKHGQPINSGVVNGSHGTANGITKCAADPANIANFPKDNVDEWPAPKQTHSFYFVKFRPFEDPKLKVKMDQADKEFFFKKKNQARFQLTEAIKFKRADRPAVIAQQQKTSNTELEPIQAALSKLCTASKTIREKGVGLCSSEEELNDLIANMHYRMQHESISLGEEKQMLLKIKQREGTRDEVIANAAMKAIAIDIVSLQEEMVALIQKKG